MRDGSPIPFGVFTVDATLVIRTWPDWLASVTGIQAADAIGHPLSAIMPDALDRGLDAALERVLAGGTVEVLAAALHRFVIACPPSAPSDLFDRMQQRVTVGPIRTEGRVTGAVVTIEDVTARLERERALARRLASGAGTTPSPDDEGAGTGRDDSVDTLTGALADPDRAIRQSAVLGLAAHGEAVVQALVATIRDQHEDLNVLSSALALLELSDIDVVEPLAACLRDPDVNLRVQAALVLGQRRDRRAIAPLIRALDDEDVNVRFHAIEALGHLGATEAAGALLEIASSGDFYLAFPAIQTLAQLGDATVAPRLAPLLGDELLRGATVEALGVLGDDAVVRPLLELLGRPGAPADTIADALCTVHDRLEAHYGAGERVADLVRRSIGPAGTQHLLDAVDRVSGERLRGLTRVLGWLDGAEVQQALARLLAHPTVRGPVVEALVRHGARVVDLLIAQLAAGDTEARQAAAAALGRIGDGRASAALVAALDDRDLVLVAADALARIGSSEAFEPLLALVGDTNVATRQAAIGALHSIGHPAMPERVCGLLEDPDPVVRESAVKVAGYFGYPQCLEAVLSLGTDPSDVVRRAVAEHLPFFENPRAAAMACTLVASDPSPRVRAAAAAALGRLDETTAGTALLAALDDADPWVRYFALRSAAAWRSPSLTPHVMARLDDRAGQVRLAAIDALGALAAEEAATALAPLADTDDADLAGASIRALARLQHPVAADTIDRATRSRDVWRRQHAVAALVLRAGVDAIERLRWMAAGDADPTVADAAVQALVRAATGPVAPVAIRALVALLAEPDRAAPAIAALATLPPRHAGEVALGLQHPVAAVRHRVIDALGRMRNPDASRAIAGALHDSDPGVRLAAIETLRQLGTAGLARTLLAIARQDADPDVRRAALRIATGSRQD